MSRDTSLEKHVFHFGFVGHPVYLETMATRPDVILHELDYQGPKDKADEVFAIAHAYQIDSARNVIPEQYFAHAALLARCPNLLVISTNGAGYDPVNVDDCTAAGVIVVNQSGGNREAVAEHALGLIIATSKRIAETDRQMRAGTARERLYYMGDEVFGKTLGVIGIGNTGGRMAEICSTALGMPVLAFDPYLDAETIAAKGATKVEFDELLAEADYVSVHCPLNAASEMMFDAAAFAKMKQGAYFITTARGGIHDEMALYDALKSGHLAGAGLDVWEPEPPTSDHPLLSLENVVASPHTAGSTHTARQNLGRGGAQQLIDVLDGEKPPRLINPEAWPAFVERYARILGKATADA